MSSIRLRSAVDAGEVSLANAEWLADAAQYTSPETVGSASDLLAQAKELPPDRFAREVGAWTQRHQSDHGHEDWLNKRRQRYLRTWKRQDGMVRLDGLLDPRPAPASAHAWKEPPSNCAAETSNRPAPAPLPNESNGTDGEGGRSWDQLRADALDLLTSGAAGGSKGRGGSSGRSKAEVIVVADIGVLTGTDPAGRCEIPGTGPVPPAVLERIACDASLTGLLFAKGKPLYHGATVRTAANDQWRALIARDRGCIGCGAEPCRCQAHHVVPYAQSRRTDIDNLVLVCWKCHHNIHDHNWQVTHRNGKPALQPPDPHAPPHTPAEESSQTPTRQAGGWHGGKVLAAPRPKPRP